MNKDARRRRKRPRVRGRRVRLIAPVLARLSRFAFPVICGGGGGVILGYAVSAFHCQCRALASMGLHPVLATAVVGACVGIVHELTEPAALLQLRSRRAWMATLALPSGVAGVVESLMWAAPWYAGPLLVVTGAIAGAALELYLTDADRRRREGRTVSQTPAGAVMAAGLIGHAAILGWLSRH